MAVSCLSSLVATRPIFASVFPFTAAMIAAASDAKAIVGVIAAALAAEFDPLASESPKPSAISSATVFSFLAFFAVAVVDAYVDQGSTPQAQGSAMAYCAVVALRVSAELFAVNLAAKPEVHDQPPWQNASEDMRLSAKLLTTCHKAEDPQIDPVRIQKHSAHTPPHRKEYSSKQRPKIEHRGDSRDFKCYGQVSSVSEFSCSTAMREKAHGAILTA